MGNYIAVTDVQSMIQGVTFSDDTKPSWTEVDGFVTMIEAEMNTAFKQVGFIVPITGTESLKVVKKITLFGASAWALDAMYGMTSEEENKRAARWWKTYENGVNAIVSSGGDELHDAPRTESVRVNTAPVLSCPTSVEASMTFGQLARHRQLYNERQLRGFRSWGQTKG